MVATHHDGMATRTPDPAYIDSPDGGDDPTLGAELGARIRQARLERGLSQTDLGKALGYKSSMVSAFESGTRRLKVEDLAKLCVALDKEPEYFLRTQAIREARRRPVALTLRAQIADLHHEELSEAITAFLDEVDRQPLPRSHVPDYHHLKPHGAARELLDSYGIKEPPVQLEGLVDKLGIPMLLWDFPASLSALIVEVDKGDYVIGVNQGHHDNRQRFSIAHEAGHAVLRHEAGYYLEFFNSADGDPPNFRYADEREANAFAAALLMDERWLRDDWAGGERSLHKLARRYEVSEEAMSFRLMNIGLA
jgi:transcriptional regulator with XRE-family HTH domain